MLRPCGLGVVAGVLGALVAGAGRVADLLNDLTGWVQERVVDRIEGEG